MLVSVFEMGESWVEEDEAECLHTEKNKTIPAKKIIGFMVSSFYVTKFRKALLQTKLFSRNYKAKELIILRNSHLTVLYF